MNAMTHTWAGPMPCPEDLQGPTRTTPLFDGLTDTQTQLVNQSFREETYRDGDTLSRDPANAPFVALLKYGTLREDLRAPDGGSRLFALTFAGETLAPLAPRHAGDRLSAVGAVRLLTCDRNGFGRLAMEIPRLHVNLLGLLQDKLADAHRWQTLLGRKTASERIASMLAWFHVRQDTLDEVLLPVSRLELGQMSGLTLETVSRQMRALVKAGVIALPQPTRAQILDPDTLQNLTGDVPAGRFYLS